MKNKQKGFIGKGLADAVARMIIILCIVSAFVGCGEYGEKIDKEIIASYKYECLKQGYKNIQVTYLFGRPSSYYHCF